MDTLVRHNFARPFQPNSRLTKADAAAVAALIGGLTEPDADDVQQLDRILAAAYGAAAASPGTFTEAVQEHGGLAVARAVEASFSLSGRPCQDIVQAAEDVAIEAAEDGTWRAGPPLFPEDDLEPEASQTAEVIVTDDPVVAEPATAEDEPPGEVAPAAQDSQAAGYDFDYADDNEYRGNIDANELTEAEEAYRRRAYEAVLHYARDYGLAIIPVWWMKDEAACACRQGELCDPRNKAKHPWPLRWPEVATSDPEQAARWWRKLEPGEPVIDWFPRANIGGVMSGKYFITDVDTDDGKQGDESLAFLEERGGEIMPVTLTWRTGGGGRQYMLLIPEGIEVRNSTGKIAPGIDIKGYNGYGILPPSRSGKGEYFMLTDVAPDVHPPGWEAEWLCEQHLQRTEHIRAHPVGDLRQIPQDGLTKRAHGYVTAAFADAVEKVAAAPKNTRNNTLNEQCFDLFAKFVPAGLLSADDVAAAMQNAGEACGLESGAVYATINSARRGGERKDRTSELPDFLFEDPDQEESKPPGRVLPHPGSPMRVARVIAEEDLATPQGLPSLRWHRGGFARWDGTAWPAEEPAAVRKQLYEITEHAWVKDEDKDGKVRHAPWNPVPKSITALLETLGIAALQLPHRMEPPFWITSGEQERGLIPMANGLLDPVTRKLMPHTPDFFNSWSLPYDYDPDAPRPAEWLRFLGELWPDEPDSIAFLQELCGHLVSGETDQQKVPLMHGAKRGGKGTTIRVLIALLGAMNVTTPTFANLMEPFGLEPLLGKPLAVISDMRVGGKGIQAAIERLLTISGGDMSTVHRKNKSALEVRLPTRFLLVSNELFALRDAAAALVSRTIPLAFTRSWLGKEDLGLGARLTAPRELTRILPWALDGLDRLHEKGRFTMPEGAEETLAELEGLASPVRAWAQAACEFGPDCSDRIETLHASFEAWAIRQRMAIVPELAIFARNLRAAYPELKIKRPRTEDDEKRPRIYTGIKVRT